MSALDFILFLSVNFLWIQETYIYIWGINVNVCEEPLKRKSEAAIMCVHDNFYYPI